uniref:Aminotransferase class I/classII large domain-containing protein n=2 Tax=Lotharella globosa TaxID=91324 RepID=A0A7S3YY41_9EUKA
MVLSLLQQWGEEGLQAHIEKLQRMYQTRRNIVADAFDQHLKGLADWRVPDAGMFFWLRPKSLEAEKKDSRSLIPILLKHNVLVVPGGIFKAEGSDAPSPWLRLAFSYATDDDLKKGVEKLALVLKESAVASEEKEKASSS